MVEYGRNPDIAAEFEYWIDTGNFKEEPCVKEQGYTAKTIAALSPLMNGASAFSLLVELRENPVKALNRIKEGFSLQ